MKLSCIVPSYKDPSLHKTIDSILDNAVGEVEINVVLDAYWPIQQIRDDPRIKVLHLGKNRGMREAINAGVLMSTGDVLMRTDEHCSFAKGFDKAIIDALEDDQIVTPTRYELDVVNWKRMSDPAVNFTKLSIQSVSDTVKKFTAVPWKARDEELKDVMIAETMGMQGSCWFMKRSWWDKVIVGLQTEGYGPLIQDSTEMIFKTWKAGGKMMLNKNTWHAHRHRKFGRKHNNGTSENPANQDAGYQYAIDVWGGYYNDVIKPKWKI